MILMNMLWSFVSLFINYFTNFLITPYVTNNIGVEAYGYVALANTFISYVDIIAVGLNLFAGRFIAIAYHKEDKKQANAYFSSTLLADLLLSVLLLAGGGVVIWNLAALCHVPSALERDVQWLFFFVLLRYLITILRTALDAAAFITERIDLAERLQSAAYLLQAGVLLALCVLLVPHVFYVGLASAAGAVLLLVGNFVLCRRLTPELHFEWQGCSWAAVWEIFSTGIWTSLNNLGNVLNSGLDLLITDLMLGATVLGQLSVSKNLATLLTSMILKISTAFRPRLLRLYADEKYPELAGLLKRSMRLTSGFCSLVIVGFYLCGKDFLLLWLPGQDTNFLFRTGMIVLLSDVAVGAVQPLYYVYTLTKKLKVPCVITILMGLANVTSMYFLLRYTSLGAYAVILTTLVINMVHFVDAPVYAAHCLGLPLTTFYPTLVQCALAFGAAFALGSAWSGALPAAESWLTLAVKAVVAGAVLLVVLALCLLPGSGATQTIKAKVCERWKRSGC